jgi:hypothetical protein
MNRCRKHQQLHRPEAKLKRLRKNPSQRGLLNFTTVKTILLEHNMSFLTSRSGGAAGSSTVVTAPPDDDRTQ